MKQHAFIVTSAMNTKFGVFSPEERLAQTIDTINSITSRVPEASIILLEMAGEPLTEEQKETLNPYIDLLLDFTENPVVKSIYESPNWDIVKNSTELMCFGAALRQLKQAEALNDFDRVFKISGRYVLNDKFDINYYEQAALSNKIGIKKRMPSQFSYETTQVAEQYMSRLWSFPTNRLDTIINVYDNMLKFMSERVNAGGYVDIEHCLFKFLPQADIIELDSTGLSGLLGPNGRQIVD
jgi:hypothetical protein